MYKYSFNGKENDNEVKGSGNQQDYGMRIYDPRLGKFLSIDPLSNKFPELSVYQFASNTPIWAADLDGLEAWIKTRDWSIDDRYGYSEFVTAELKKMTTAAVQGEISKNTCFDCADLATTLLIRYAAKNGLPLSFTSNRDGKEKLNFDDTKYKSMEDFEDDVRSKTGASSLFKYEMSKIEGDPIAGDLQPSDAHINVVREDDPNNPVGQNRVPTVSGTLPEWSWATESLIDPSPKPYGGVPILNVGDRNRYSSVSKDADFRRFNVLNKVTIDKIETKQIKLDSTIDHDKLELK